MTAEEFMNRKRVSRSKADWRIIENRRIYFRSKWEANYARFLSFMKQHNQIKEWEHEPETFWFEKIRRGVRSYLPDFKVTNLDGSHYWVEVKGYLDSRSLTKLKRLAKYYPEEKLQLIQKDWFSLNNRKLRPLIPDWE